MHAFILLLYPSDYNPILLTMLVEGVLIAHEVFHPKQESLIIIADLTIP